jgi:hypothetical protein
MPFQSEIFTRRSMWAGVQQSGLTSPALVSLYITTCPRCITRSAVTARCEGHESCSHVLQGLEHWSLNCKKMASTTVLFAKTARRTQEHKPVKFFGEPVEWVHHGTLG